MDLAERRDALSRLLDPVLDAAGRAWLAEGCAALESPDAGQAIDPLWRLSSGAARQLGRGALVTSDADARLALGGGDALPIAAWTLADAGRALLLLALATAAPASAPARVRAVYRNGDVAERESVCRALNVLAPITPGVAPPEPLLEVLLDALRTNTVRLYDAASADSWAFSRWLPELEFNKYVLKRTFYSLPLSRVVGLVERANPELSRMLEEFANGAEIARRPYPLEIWEVVARAPTPGLAARLTGMIEHPREEVRLGGAAALFVLGDPTTAGAISDRLGRETRPSVRELLARCLGAQAGPPAPPANAVRP